MVQHGSEFRAAAGCDRPVSADDPDHGLLDIAIMVFVLYKVLTLVQSTKAASLLKGLFVFLAALVLSSLFHLNGINYIMSKMVEWGVLALIILFQPEIRRVLEQMGSRRFIAFFTHAETGNAMEHDHRPDGAGLHRDVPVPHRCPDCL